jgi:hypothetical protein
MPTHRNTWKRRERDAARRFGVHRQPGSGSGGRADQTRSDSTHERLYIEAKLRAASSVRTLWEKTAALARREAKTPVLMLYAKGKPGGLVVCHESHLQAVAAELAGQGRAEAAGRPVEPGGLPADPEPFHPGEIDR